MIQVFNAEDGVYQSVCATDYSTLNSAIVDAFRRQPEEIAELTLIDNNADIVISDNNSDSVPWSSSLKVKVKFVSTIEELETAEKRSDEELSFSSAVLCDTIEELLQTPDAHKFFEITTESDDSTLDRGVVDRLAKSASRIFRVRSKETAQERIVNRVCDSLDNTVNAGKMVARITILHEILKERSFRFNAAEKTLDLSTRSLKERTLTLGATEKTLGPESKREK